MHRWFSKTCGRGYSPSSLCSAWCLICACGGIGKCPQIVKKRAHGDELARCLHVEIGSRSFPHNSKSLFFPALLSEYWQILRECYHH
mmetsp:Transcript_28729/g.45700  ORF Transcript_28729/g.45700 Transcript_28729/m.45700 type:complete len:87 (+) Transcript_28729:755-1015(+)